MECFACGAGLGPSLDTCPSCDAPQSEAVQRLHARLRSALSMVERWRVIALVATVVGFALGLGAGQMRTPSVEPVASAAETPAGDLDIESFAAAFRASLNEAIGLGAERWAWGSDSTLVLVLTPPTASRPVVLWQALSPQERDQLMGYIGVAYTRALLGAGIPVDVENDGHPPVAVSYRGQDQALAVRHRDGTVTVFESPYDGVYSPPSDTP